MNSPFNTLSASYDAWYDTPKGQAIFAAEVACIQALAPTFPGRWLEVGVGTGRFAAALGLHEGVDPSPDMLALAKKRGINASQGSADKLPCDTDSYDGLLLALTLCFIPDAPPALSECHRVLKPDGTLILGFVPGDTPWGQLYTAKKEAGHPIYSAATFHPLASIIAATKAAGFTLRQSASTLDCPAGEPPPIPAPLHVPAAATDSFIAMTFTPA